MCLGDPFLAMRLMQLLVFFESAGTSSESTLESWRTGLARVDC